MQLKSVLAMWVLGHDGVRAGPYRCWAWTALLLWRHGGMDPRARATLEHGQDTAAARGAAVVRRNGGVGRRLGSAGRRGAWAGAAELAARRLAVEACSRAGVTRAGHGG